MAGDRREASREELDAQLVHELRVHQVELEMQNRELREAQAALEVSRNRYADLYDFAPVAYLTLDLAARIVEINLTAATMIGRSRETAVGLPFLSLVEIEEPGLLWSHLKRCAAREQPEVVELRLATRRGAFDVRMTTSPVMDAEGRATLFRTAFTDITDAKRAERELALLAELGQAMATTLDEQATPRDVARTIARTLADLCVVETIDDAGRVHRTVEHRDPARADVARALERVILDAKRPHLGSVALGRTEPVLIDDLTPEAAEGLVQSDEHRRALDGLVPCALIAAPMWARGRQVGFLALVQHDTSRRFTAADVPIAREVAHRAALGIDNARLYAAAQRAVRARDDVLGVVAHDLRNPLGAILIQAGQLKRVPDGKGGERRNLTPVEMIERAAKRMRHIIEDLIDAAAIDAGHLSLRAAPLPVPTALSDAVEAESVLAQAAGVELVVDVPPAVAAVSVLADRARLLQVFENLVGNAIKFASPRGRVTLAAERRGAHVGFSVADTGPGIPREHIAHLFDRFWQGGSAEAGAGLGLAIVKGIVEAHGGTVSAELREPGRGACLSFTIPIAVSDHESPVVLVAEDDADLRGALGDALELAGYSVVAVDNGKKALDYLKNAPPPASIILDIAMPVMDGWAFLEGKNADPALRGIPAVVVSAQKGIAERVAALHARCIEKPIEPERLLAAVQQSLVDADASDQARGAPASASST